MPQVVFTADRYFFGDETFTFFVYDVDEQKIVHKQGKIDELEFTDFKLADRPSFRPYGISQNKDRLYVVCHAKVAMFDKNDFSYLGCVEGARAFVNTHQILKTDDRLYICNTSCDSLGIFEDGAMRYWSFKTHELLDAIDAPTDVNSQDRLHVNSVHEQGDDLFLLFTDKNRKLGGAIVCLDKNTFERKYLIEAGNKLHNITIIGESLYTLSTGTGELIECDLKTREFEIYPLAVPDEIYLRGMVNLDGNLLISHSRNFKSSANLGFSYLKLFNTEEKFIETNYIINKVDILNNMQLLEP